MNEAQIILKNQLDELDRLTDWIAYLEEKQSFSKKLVFALELVLAEAVTNIVQHAFPAGQDHEILIKLSVGAGAISVEIRDDGVPFDPLQQPDVEFPSSLDEATEGGLGIHLIRSYAQTCTYQRQAGENVLVLTLAREN